MDLSRVEIEGNHHSDQSEEASRSDQNKTNSYRLESPGVIGPILCLIFLFRYSPDDLFAWGFYKKSHLLKNMLNDSTNETNLIPHLIQWYPGLQTVACIFYTITLLIGIIGNILVMIIVARYRDMRNATNLLLTNLSVADLFLLVFCTADGYQHLYGKDKHRLGTFMCSFGPFVQNATSTCSVLTIMAISYERFVAICKPLKTTSLHLTLFRTLPTVIFFWFVSCVISIPFFRYSITSLELASYNETIVTCFTRFPSSWANEYLISCTFCLYLFILVLLCYWHCSICCVLFSREALLQDNTLVTKSRRQAAQLLIVLIITFFILILPHKIWAIVQQRLNYKQLIRIGFRRHSLIIICTRSLLYLNSAVNPLLYSIMSTKFRQSFLQLCRECRSPSKYRTSTDHLSYRDHSRRSYHLSRLPVRQSQSTVANRRTSPVYRNPLMIKKTLSNEPSQSSICNYSPGETKFTFAPARTVQ